jgi:hypothetical protein
MTALLPDLMTRKIRLHEYVIGGAILTGGLRVFNTLRQAGWKPEVDQTLKRLWAWIEAARPSDDEFSERLAKIIVKYHLINTIYEWELCFDDVLVRDLSLQHSEAVALWALEQINHIKTLRDEYSYFVGMINSQVIFDPVGV